MNESPADLLSADYLTALRFHVQKGSPETLQAAQGLGRAAVKYDIETLKFAHMHDQALAVLLSAEPSIIRQMEITRLAVEFFGEANMPIEDTHHAARADSVDLEQLNSSLNQRTLDLAASNRELKAQIVMRKSAEVTHKTRDHSSSQLLRDSQLLEQNLQEMTRRIITATENERQVMSLLLNDEIAQVLLGINIRMIALKNEIATDPVNHNHQIAMIQHLVEDSADMLIHLAHEFSEPHT